jgi:transcriptional regulator with PAS, ATPase and Fis domain/tetratricopeptide (TPR) repeat protein
MNPLEHARTSAANGLFSDALRVLNESVIPREGRIAAAVLSSELLERTGHYKQARAGAETLLKSAHLSPEHRATCDFVLGRIAADEGQSDIATAHLQRSITTATAARDFERVAWAQMRMLIILFDASGPEAVAPLLSELRANAARTGNPHVFAALHLNIAQMECKRGLLGSADRHIKLAIKNLADCPNTWLYAMVEENQAALACLKLNFSEGVQHAERAGDLSAKAGWAAGASASTAILGNLLYYTGRLEEAAACCLRALNGFIYGSDNYSGTLETLARIRLSQGRPDECEEILQQIELCLSSAEIRSRFVYRYTLLTRARASHHRSDYKQALDALDEALHLATKTCDNSLRATARLAKAQLLAEINRSSELVPVFDDLTREITLQPPDRHAAYEHILACGLISMGDIVPARQHVAQARVIYEAVEHRLGLLELATCPVVSTLSSAGSTTVGGDESKCQHRVGAVEQHMLQAVVGVLNHVGRPKLIAREILNLVNGADCVSTALAISRNSDGDEDVFASVHREDPNASTLEERRFTVGREGDRSIELVLRPKPQINACATVNAIARLLGTVTELERARADREERATIWPADELHLDDQSVISGHMREIMMLAQRVARTTVNVLITGDSGTGKEIVARAIHNYSARAQKPFVPFNCAAVPRDLVESQLFGHRRGAFTGADRDYMGLIRAARDGTLFLDEIGELGIDLQPKFLRFLESGEISPLGENAQITVNVRIVAATNAHLEDAVRDGKFREDLFYRLNVVRLSLKPLRERRDEIPGLVTHFVARAAHEFAKGHLEIAEETMERLLLYRWPGNIRQLQNELRRMVALAEPNSTLEPSAISDDILRAMPIFRNGPISGQEIAVRLSDKLLPTLSLVECEMIKTALRENHGKVDAVARALGISRKGLYLKRQRLGL